VPERSWAKMALSECPPCGAESLLPVCRALAIRGWAGCTADDAGDDVFESPAPPGVFSTRRPRDAIAGAASGVKTLGRSLAAGATSLATGPGRGANDGGALGAVWGFGEGVANAMVLPCVGLAVGMAQFARGVANTPVAVVETLQGLQWNERDRIWETSSYNLREEARQLRRQHRGDGGGGRRRRSRGPRAKRGDGGGVGDDEGLGGDRGPASPAGARVADRGARCESGGAAEAVRRVERHTRATGYYALLRVQPTATAAEIRRAYYRESRRCHPDKVGASRNAVTQFQQVSEAYKVLRSPELRRAYDEGGSEAVTRMSSTLDLGMLYAAALSGGQWEPYLGRFALSRILSCSACDDEHDGGQTCLESLAELWIVCDDAPDAWQARREVRCAVALAERLQPAVAGDFAQFESRIRAEAKSLADAPFAPGLLMAMATVYDSEALRFLGALRLLDPRRELARIGSQSRLLQCQVQAACAGFRAALSLQRLMEDEGGTPVQPDTCRAGERQRATSSLCLERPAVQAQLPTLAKALWTLTLLDVEGTLRRVCRRVLRDNAQTLPSRVQRAEGLRIAARVLREAAEERLWSRGARGGRGFLEGARPRRRRVRCCRKRCLLRGR